MSSRFAEAIKQHRVVEFSYKGRSHTVEPHAVGYDETGALVLHGWELSGGRGQGFRGFDTRTIRALTITRKQFGGARPDYVATSVPLHTIVFAL